MFQQLNFYLRNFLKLINIRRQPNLSEDFHLQLKFTFQFYLEYSKCLSLDEEKKKEIDSTHPIQQKGGMPLLGKICRKRNTLAGRRWTISLEKDHF